MLILQISMKSEEMPTESSMVSDYSGGNEEMKEVKLQIGIAVDLTVKAQE